MNKECEHDANRQPLDIKDDPLHGTVEIEGKKYSYEFLRDVLPILVKEKK